MEKEPQIIDFYKPYPSCFDVIEKLNQEFEELRKENELLKQKTKHFDYIISYFKRTDISKNMKFKWILNN
tara:strand:- start:76 stop:285 length:210 start_codon:yes stop_codon:yes gene_type:complete